LPASADPVSRKIQFRPPKQCAGRGKMAARIQRPNKRLGTKKHGISGIRPQIQTADI